MNSAFRFLCMLALIPVLQAEPERPYAAPGPLNLTSSLQEAPSKTCAVTTQASGTFVPPPNYPKVPERENTFWYGTKGLWTNLDTLGIWAHLPRDGSAYRNKLFWWSDGYDWEKEPQPQLRVTGRSLESPATALIASTASNGHRDDIGSFIAVVVELPKAGCWEITGQRGNRELKYVVWVTP